MPWASLVATAEMSAPAAEAIAANWGHVVAMIPQSATRVPLIMVGRLFLIIMCSPFHGLYVIPKESMPTLNPLDAAFLVPFTVHRIVCDWLTSSA